MEKIGSEKYGLILKAATLAVLFLMGAGVWYFVKSRTGTDNSPRVAPASSWPAAATGPGAAKDSVPEQSGLGPALDIRGTGEFKERVTQALKLIWLYDRETFLLVKKRAGTIRQDNKTGFYADYGEPVIMISSANAFRSLTWCAGIIAHQAFHADSGSSRKKKKAVPVPGEPGRTGPLSNPGKVDFTSLDSMLLAEQNASIFQARSLEKVGAPRSEIKAVLTRRPKDFSTGHDGGYSILP